MKVGYTSEAKKQLEKLPPQEVRKIIRKIQTLEISATEGKKLRGEFAGSRAIRAWPYRIVYYLASEEIVIISIKHRQGVYK